MKKFNERRSCSAAVRAAASPAGTDLHLTADGNKATRGKRNTLSKTKPSDSTGDDTAPGNLSAAEAAAAAAEAARKARRLEANRKSAERSRMRRIAHVGKMEVDLHGVVKDMRTMLSEVQAYRDRHAMLVRQNEVLKAHYANLCGTTVQNLPPMQQLPSQKQKQPKAGFVLPALLPPVPITMQQDQTQLAGFAGTTAATHWNSPRQSMDGVSQHQQQPFGRQSQQTSPVMVKRTSDMMQGSLLGQRSQPGCPGPTVATMQHMSAKAQQLMNSGLGSAYHQQGSQVPPAGRQTFNRNTPGPANGASVKRDSQLTGHGSLMMDNLTVTKRRFSSPEHTDMSPNQHRARHSSDSDTNDDHLGLPFPDEDGLMDDHEAQLAAMDLTNWLRAA